MEIQVVIKGCAALGRLERVGGVVVVIGSNTAVNTRDNLVEDCSAAYHNLDKEWTVKYADRLALPNKKLTNYTCCTWAGGTGSE